MEGGQFALSLIISRINQAHDDDDEHAKYDANFASGWRQPRPPRMAD